MTNERTIKVGDMFIESWGYDQTNVDVYEVVRVTAKSVALMQGNVTVVDSRVLPISGSPTPFDSDYCRIGKPNKRGEVMKRISEGWRGEPWLSMTSYSGAHLWNGERDYHDTFVAGMEGH